VYLGLLIGILLSFMAKEELKPGKKWFLLLHNIILGFILFFILEFLNVNVYITLLLPLALIVFLFKYSELYRKSWVVYILLGIIFYLSSKNINWLLINSTLMLFYGFLVSALQFKKKDYLRILYINLGFFVCLIFLIYLPL
jgi:hypothetical protein